MNSGDDSRFHGWTVIANVIRRSRKGPIEGQAYKGTRMFAPGTKVCVGPAFWGVAAERVRVVGLHRGSRRFAECVVGITALENFRVSSIYKSALASFLERIDEGIVGQGYVFVSEEEASGYRSSIARACELNRSEKLDARAAPDAAGGA